MSHMNFISHVNKRVAEMVEKTSRYMVMQRRYDNPKAWDKVLAKLDQLTDPEPIMDAILRLGNSNE